MLNTVTETSETTDFKEGFETLGLIEPLMRALASEGYTHPTPIQAQAIPHLLQGHDLMGCAQTGTGKTAAFALPILQHLAENRKHPGSRGVRALILAPTRELAFQINESFRTYGRFLKTTRALVFGGVKSGPQIRALSRGVDILVATPGRLLDLINQGCVSLKNIEVFVLDEADRMLDMGFLPDIRKIYKTVPENRQSMLFSATFPTEIMSFTKQFLHSPVTVTVAPPVRKVESIDQRVLFVDRENKGALLESCLEDESVSRVMVFTRTKHGANRVANNLKKSRIRTGVIHGNKSQSARVQALEQFRSGKARVLVATDVAARGLDIDGVTHVINYDLPMEAESYVHRIGRTARAGATGVALSFVDANEYSYLWRIEKEINRPVGVDVNHPFHSARVEAKSASRTRGSRSGQSNGNPRKGAPSAGRFRKGPGGSGKPAFSSGKPKSKSRSFSASRRQGR